MGSGAEHDRAELIAAGNVAAEHRSWAEAFEALAAADALAPLDPDGLVALANAADLMAHPEVAVDARQRAFAQLRRSDPGGAAYLAAQVAMAQFSRDAMAVGRGWIQQAVDLLADQDDCEASAFLAWAEAVGLSESGETPAALEAADGVVELARRVDSVDMEALGSLLKGQILTGQGHLEEGAALMDPAMTLAVSGVLSPMTTALVYCGTISTCASTGDLQRAWEWTDEVNRCSVGGSTDFPGDCRMHRAEIMRVRGEWTKAEVELASLCDQLGTWHVGHVASAHYELGVLSLHRGDLSAAATAFAQSRELGHTTLPGAAWLELASGNAEAAIALLQSELAIASAPLDRLTLLPAAVEALLAGGRMEDAQASSHELHTLSANWPAPMHHARAAHAAGAVAVALGDAAAANASLTEAIEWWRKVPAPYDEARARVLLGLSEERAARTGHLETALEVFTRLGAVLDAEAVLGHLGRSVEVERETLALMFTDIEGSTEMLADLGDAAWREVLRRHDDCLRDLFARHRGKVLTGTGDGFFVGFPTSDDALDCAAEIQGTVEEVRVRIGVHLAEVNRDRDGYSGRGVHEAARISALGAGGDIVVSSAALQGTAASRRTYGTRTVELKGLPGEMEVAFLD